MQKPDISTLFNRRAFAKLAAGAVVSPVFSAGDDRRSRDSVPGDPDAPTPNLGTVDETGPFDGPLTYARRDAEIKAKPFPMTQVRLLPGVFLDTKDANLIILRELPVDRLLHTFRLNAGLPSNAEPLGGWEKPKSELRGHYIGHYLSGCALMYASTGEEAMKAKAGTMVTELAKCQEKLGDGYLSAFPVAFFDRLKARKKVWAPFYTVHKIMAGLLDIHQHCGNDQALAVLEGMAGWIDRWSAEIPEEKFQAILDTEYGGMNDIYYNLAVVTGKDRYVAVGDRFTRKRFFNPLALRRDELLGLHANTHIPQVIGAARRYEISSDSRFHDVSECFWQEVAHTRTYATGGTSNNEGWLVEPNHLAQEMRIDSAHAADLFHPIEGVDRGSAISECCCAYNMMKLTRMLYSWTADPRYFDYYERALYNHRLGTIDLKTGVSQYYLGTVPGSWRTFGSVTESFWCCNGTAAEEYAKLNDSIYFHGGDSLYVNLFIPSELNWTEKGVRLRQLNHFPESQSTKLIFDASSKTALKLHVRIPTWVAGEATVKINGRAVEASANGGSYLTLRRMWAKGDTVEVELPMELRREAMSDDASLQAFFYGPFVLAGDLGGEGITQELIANRMGPDLHHHPLEVPALRAQEKELSSLIKPSIGPLAFQTAGQERNIAFKPLYKVTEGRYSIYWKVMQSDI